MKTLNIHIERLAAALATKGLRLKRHNLLEVVAAAFGYHNHNEAKAAADRGDLDVPRADLIGRTTTAGQDFVVLKDPRADALYAVPASQMPAAGKTGSIGITPYGNMVELADVGGVSDAITAPSEESKDVVHIALIHHSHGVDVVAGGTRLEVGGKVAQHARENWYEAYDNDKYSGAETIGLPEDHEGLSDDEAEDLYFRAVSASDPGNYVEYETVEVTPRSNRTLDPRYRSYPSTSNPHEPFEADYHSAHGSLKDAISCSTANRRGGFDSYVVDHVGRRFWRASKNWAEERFDA